MLKMTDALIEQRAVVWMALAELFLDTELAAADYDRLATVLAASPYAEDKLEEILRFEVTPVLKSNLMNVAGEWDGFDPAWLREKLMPRIDHRPFFRWPVSHLVRRPWQEVRSRVVRRRMEDRGRMTEDGASSVRSVGKNARG